MPDPQDFPGLTLAPNAIHQEDVARWLKAKRQAVEAWIARHTPEPSSVDRALVETRGGRYPGEVPVAPTRGIATAATEAGAPRTMADLMLMTAGPVVGGLQRRASAFTRIPARYKAAVYERARALDPESALWANPVPPEMDVYQATSGADEYYGLGPGYANPSVTEIEMVSRQTSPDALRDAVRRGGETSLLFDVPTAENLPKTLDPHGFESAWAEPYDMAYGPPSPELQAAWQTQGWRVGDPLPGVKFMVRPTTRPAPRVIPRYARSAPVRAPSGDGRPPG